MIEVSKFLLKNSHEKLAFSSILIVFLVSLAPIMMIIFHDDFSRNIYANVSFIVIAFSYFVSYFSEAQKESYVFKNAKHDDQDFERTLDQIFSQKKLTKRECEVGILLLQGKSFKEIADMLFISDQTARRHGANMYVKLEVSDLKNFRETFGRILKEK